jgi:hypothetical protein
MPNYERILKLGKESRPSLRPVALSSSIPLARPTPTSHPAASPRLSQSPVTQPQYPLSTSSQSQSLSRSSLSGVSSCHLRPLPPRPVSPSASLYDPLVSFSRSPSPVSEENVNADEAERRGDADPPGRLVEASGASSKRKKGLSDQQSKRIKMYEDVSMVATALAGHMEKVEELQRSDSAKIDRLIDLLGHRLPERD